MCVCVKSVYWHILLLCFRLRPSALYCTICAICNNLWQQADQTARAYVHPGTTGMSWCNALLHCHEQNRHIWTVNAWKLLQMPEELMLCIGAWTACEALCPAGQHRIFAVTLQAFVARPSSPLRLYNAVNDIHVEAINEINEIVPTRHLLMWSLSTLMRNLLHGFSIPITRHLQPSVLSPSWKCCTDDILHVRWHAWNDKLTCCAWDSQGLPV